MKKQINQRKVNRIELKNKITTIATEDYPPVNPFAEVVVCQQCRCILPPQAKKYIFNYCPNCGRKIKRGEK